MLIMAVFYLRQ